MDVRIEPGRGVYDAVRASALSGVPKSTIHYWARHDVLSPEVAAEPRTRLWSWGDLVVMRLIHWLRRDKPEIRHSPMADVRNLVAELRSGSFHVAEISRMIAVSESGRVAIKIDSEEFALIAGGQRFLPGVLHLVRPYESGPDLLQPSSRLSIIPGKLSGEPHVRDSRVATATLWALRQRGLDFDELERLYPDLEPQSIRESIELEQRLAAA